MSDAYGVGNALKAFHHSITLASRATGRTTRMLEQVKDGDRIVVARDGAKSHLMRYLKEMRKDVDIMVVDPKNPHDGLFRRGTAKGYVHFDHDWVDEYYRVALERITDDFMRLPRELSGHGVAHAETRMKYRAMGRQLGQYPNDFEIFQIPDSYIK